MVVNEIRIFEFYDGGMYMFYAGKTEEECINEYKSQTGLDDDYVTADISITELTADDLKKYTVTCPETGKTQTFREHLDELISGEFQFPTYFAGDEN